MKNNLPMALAAGAVASLASAAVWAAVTVVTNYQIGWMAIGVGFLVGLAVRKFGQGETVLFRVVGAGLALVGCLLGNLFSGIGFIAAEEAMPIGEALLNFDYGYSAELLGAMFSPMDLLFYGLALYQAFKLSAAEPEEAIAA
ncbi:MAG: hypothetical protein ABII82_01365 [Verrucomicrobiota bacterium]